MGGFNARHAAIAFQNPADRLSGRLEKLCGHGTFGLDNALVIESPILDFAIGELAVLRCCAVSLRSCLSRPALRRRRQYLVVKRVDDGGRQRLTGKPAAVTNFQPYIGGVEKSTFGGVPKRENHWLICR